MSIGRIGNAGMNVSPTSPAQSPLVQNLVCTTDGVWRPRQGLTTRYTASSSIHHVSARPWKDGESGWSGNRIVVGEGTALRLVSHTAYTATNLDTSSWGGARPLGFPMAIGGNNSTGIYWIAPRLASYGDGAGHPGSLYRINNGATEAIIAGSPPSAIWVESYGKYTVAVDRSSFYWSAASNSDSWTTSTDTIKAPREIGQLCAFVTVDQQQALLFGTLGVAKFWGATTTTFALRPEWKIGCVGYQTVCRVGDNEVFWVGHGNSVWRATFAGARRVDYPIHWKLWNANPNNLRTFWDPLMNWFCLSDSGAGTTYVFDLNRDCWLGVIDQFLVGQASIFDDANLPFTRRYVGLGVKLCEWQDGVYTDGGSAFTCKLRTPSSVFQGPEVEKQLDRAYIDGAGTWSVSLMHRNTVGDPDDSWTTTSLGSVAAPGFVYGTTVMFKEGMLELSAMAASGVFLRDVVVELNGIGGPGGGPVRQSAIAPPVPASGVGFGYGV